MKQILTLLIATAMIMTWGCLEPVATEMEIPVNDDCTGNYAEFVFNDTTFFTKYSPDLGEFLTPTGIPCGISAALDLNANRLTMRIVGESQNLGMGFEVSTLSEQLPFSFVNYTNRNIDDAPFSNMVEGANNFVIIDQHDTTEESITGQFNFTVENSDGKMVNISSGKFECFYGKF